MEKSVPLLEESLTADPAVEVQETCELALRRIEEQKKVNGAESTTTSSYLSVDPALPAKHGLSVDQLRYSFSTFKAFLHVSIVFYVHSLSTVNIMENFQGSSP